MLVADSALGEVSPLAAFQAWRQVVPTAKRLVVAHWDRFLADAESCGRPGQGQVRRLPADAARRARRGVPHRRHRAALRLGLDGRGARGRDRADRLARPRRADPGDPRLPRPDGHAEPGPRPRLRGRPRDHRRGSTAPRAGFPLVESPYRGVEAPTSVRDVASAIYGRPEDIDVDTVARPLHRRRRSGRPRRGGVRRLGGALDRRRRGRGDRRPGRHLVDDPQLPRLPARHLRHAAGAARAQPGDPVRHPLLHRLGGHRADARRRRAAARGAHRRRRPARARGRRSPPGSPTARLRVDGIEALTGRGVSTAAR